jgi:arginine decarboxylase
MESLVPTKVFLTKGVGQHKYQLKSFEEALRMAGIAQQNLVQVSSILPPGCKIISKDAGLTQLIPGSICFCVMARADTDEHGRLVATSIGIAVPKDSSNWGYLSEVHAHGMNQQQAADMAEDLAAGMLGTTLGIEVDPDKAWSEKEQEYQSSGLIIRTSNITQTARGQQGLWTTVVAVAMFLFD